MLINLYCLVTILAVKKLRSLDFFLVGVQTVFDLVISGMLSIVFFYSSTLEAINKYCASKRAWDNKAKNQNGFDYERFPFSQY